MIDPEANSPLGSVIVIEAADLEEARKIADEDPYTKADVFSKVDIFPFRQAAGAVKLD